jgi:hypothetical protein
MAKKLLGPWKVLYPVRFYSGGDTTSQAFGKHIQEIERIYGLLNALDAGKAGSADIADALQKHIDSPNPHPNWKPKLSFDDISGNIDARRIYGDLVNAYIDASHVKNLQALINGAIPPPTPDKGDGIVQQYLGDNGYVRFANGLIVQWGKSSGRKGPSDAQKESISFPITFPSSVYMAIASIYTNAGGDLNNDWWYQVSDLSRSGMAVTRQTANRNLDVFTQAHWLAMGN